MLKSSRLNQRSITLLLFVILLALSAVNLAVILAMRNESLHRVIPLISVRLVVNAVLFVLYLRGWDGARHVFAIVMTALTAFSLPIASPQGLTIGILVPVLIASLISDWRGVLASSVGIVAMYAAIHGPGIITETPLSFLVYAFCVLTVILGWAIQDRSRKEASSRADEVAKLNESLEGKVAERTAELSEANARLRTALGNLQQAQDLLIVSEKMAALGQLVAGIAHEVNTPLGAIMSSVNSVKDELTVRFPDIFARWGQFDPEEQGFLLGLMRTVTATASIPDSDEERRRRRVITSLFKSEGVEEAEEFAADAAFIGDEAEAATMIPFLKGPHGREILDTVTSGATAVRSARVAELAAAQAARVIAALGLYARQPFTDTAMRVDVRNELQTLVTLYASKLSRGVRLTTRFCGDSTVMGRPDELNQVWIALWDNALEAIQYKGSIELATERGNGYLYVTIADSGTGIASEIAARVFEPFFTTRSASMGSGLGLYLAKRIVEAHGGTISFNSEPGRTVFTVSLPTGVAGTSSPGDNDG